MTDPEPEPRKPASLSAHLNPAEIAQLDREIADIQITYTAAADGIRDYRKKYPEMEDLGLLFTALTQQLSRLDRVRMCALLVEGLVRESGRR